MCVSLLRYTAHTGQHRQGFCSSYLTNLKPGDRVRFKLISQPAFRMPFNLGAPMVMVAAGTGLAPFRVGPGLLLVESKHGFNPC